MKSPKEGSTQRRSPSREWAETESYARKRWSLRKRREQDDHALFDPRPVTDDDWTVANETDEPSMSRIAAPEPLGDVLGALVAQQGWGTRLQSANLFRYWNEICGDDLATHCEPVRLAGGILVLRVESQVWATQLRYFVPEITQNIRTRLGIDKIRDVRIVVGPLENESN